MVLSCFNVSCIIVTFLVAVRAPAFARVVEPAQPVDHSENVALLVGMGFGHEEALDALIKANGRVQAAVDRLLTKTS